MSDCSLIIDIWVIYTVSILTFVTIAYTAINLVNRIETGAPTRIKLIIFYLMISNSACFIWIIANDFYF